MFRLPYFYSSESLMFYNKKSPTMYDMFCRSSTSVIRYKEITLLEREIQVNMFHESDPGHVLFIYIHI